MRSKAHTSFGPGIEEIACGDSSTRPLRPANSPVLIESLGSVDGWRIGAGGLIQVVRTSYKKDMFSKDVCTAASLLICIQWKLLAFGIPCLPSDVTVPLDATPEEGLYSPKFSRM